MSEFRDFQTRMGNKEENQLELSEINRYIEKIGNEFGAFPQHFRHEKAAEALPPYYHTFIDSNKQNDYGLRLYCIRMSNSVVILLNGDRKTKQKAQDCLNCRIHFERANKIAKAIDNAISDGFMGINEDEMLLEIDEDFDLEI